MAKQIWSPKKREVYKQQAPATRSLRAHEYRTADAQLVKKRVLQGIGLLILIYLGYLFLFSRYFQITEFIFNNNSAVSSQQLEDSIKNQLVKRHWLIIPGNNYFFVKPEKIKNELNAQGLALNLSISKKFPRRLIIDVEKTLDQVVWISAENFYLVDLKGEVKQKLENYALTTGTLPIIYDLANIEPAVNKKAADDKLWQLISETVLQLPNFDLPGIQMDYLKVDSPTSNYLKIVTKQGFEIHVSYEKPLVVQIEKLKKSLLAGKIDLQTIQYINLRIENQVIYK